MTLSPVGATQICCRQLYNLAAGGLLVSHTFARIHIIFSTKERQRLITKEMQPKLWSYMAGICRNKGIEPIAINGMDNHVHVLIHLPPAIALAKAVNFIKSNSSRWMREHRPKF